MKLARNALLICFTIATCLVTYGVVVIIQFLHHLGF